MPYSTAPDGAQTFYKDWGTGPVIFSQLNFGVQSASIARSPRCQRRILHGSEGGRCGVIAVPRYAPAHDLG